MGTNFYLGSKNGIHIGKRSAAGYYCFDCHKTLCRDGDSKVHKSEGFWFDKCPICGKTPIAEGFENSTAGIELGFNKVKSNPNVGVRSCSSFTWAIEPNKINCRKLQSKKVVDEYGRKYSLKDFLDMVETYPIWIYEAIGKEFS